jgi:rhodanese-related sulfurtransferase
MKNAIILAMIIWAAVSAFAQEKQEPMKTPTTTSSFATQPLSYTQLAELLDRGESGLYLIDVRTAEEFNSGAIPSAINIPYDLIENRLPTQDRSARIVVYCRSGKRSSIAKAKLEALEFTNVNDFGGVYNWKGKLIVR